MPFLENAAVKEREFRFHPQQGTRNFFHPLSHALVRDLSSGLGDVSAILLSFRREEKKINIPSCIWKIHHFVRKVVLSRLKAEHVCDLEIDLILNSSPKRKVCDSSTSPTPTPTPVTPSPTPCCTFFTFLSPHPPPPFLPFSSPFFLRRKIK